MKDIHLHGSLRARYGGPFSLDVRDPAEAIRALCIQLPGFKGDIAAGEWHVVRGDLDAGSAVDAEGLHLALGRTRDIHLLPAGVGAGRGGLGAALAGVALIGAGFMIGNPGLAIGALTLSGGTVAMLGASLALSGVSQMLATTPSSSYGQREAPDQRPSFLFNGPVNTSTQGLPVPIVYGRVRAGTVVISAGMTAEELDE